MSIDVNYKSDWRTYEVLHNGEKVANLPLAFLETAQEPVNAPDIAAAFKAVYDAAPNTINTFLCEEGKKTTALRELGLIAGQPKAVAEVHQLNANLA